MFASTFLNILASGILILFSIAAQGSDSCECPKLDCGPCMEEQGVTFYSEKCGPNLSRVKSCAKPTCVPQEPVSPQCKTVLNSNSVKRNIASKPKGKVQASTEMMDKRLAEFKSDLRGNDVGSVHTVLGSAFIKLPSGEELEIRKGLRVHEKDRILTTSRGHVKLLFDDGNILNIKPMSEVVVQEYQFGKKKRALLNLIKGKVRSKVKQKYDEKTSYYRIKTKSAVAGVRGTDFVVEYSEKERAVTKVSTLEGSVKFGGQQFEDRVAINGGQQASFIVASNTSEVFSEEEISDFVAKGYMTPVYDLSPGEIDQIAKVTEVGKAIAARSIASEAKATPICSSPSGQWNQCAWLCLNNPKGEKRCRTDLPQVNCVRKKCDANGNWEDETRLPASFYDSCKPTGYKVGPCDY